MVHKKYVFNYFKIYRLAEFSQEKTRSINPFFEHIPDNFKATRTHQNNLTN